MWIAEEVEEQTALKYLKMTEDSHAYYAFFCIARIMRDNDSNINDILRVESKESCAYTANFCLEKHIASLDLFMAYTYIQHRKHQYSHCPIPSAFSII